MLSNSRYSAAIKLTFGVVALSLLMGCSSLRGVSPRGPSQASSFLGGGLPAQVSKTASVQVDSVSMKSQGDYHYTLGEVLAFEGKSEEAIQQFREALIYVPEASEIRGRLAEEYIAVGLMSEAMEQAELAVEQTPESYELRFLLAGLYLSLKMYEAAESHYNQILQKNPWNLDVLMVLGALFVEKGELNKVEKVLKQLAERPEDGDSYKAFYYIGLIQSERGTSKSYKKAEEAYKKSLSLKPDNEASVLSLSQLYEEENQPQKSLQLLEDFQKQFGPKVSLAKRLSQKYLEKHNYGKASEQLEILERDAPDDLSVKIRLALILIEKKKYETAIDYLEDILRVVPESDKVRFFLAAVYEEIKDYDSAQMHFAKIPSKSRYYSEAILHLAQLNQLKGQLKEAYEILEQALKQKPENSNFYTYFITILDEQEEYQKAVDVLGRAIERFPQDVSFHYLLGLMQDRLGNEKESLELMKKVLLLDANHVKALNFIAFTYAERGEQLKRAERYALQALKLKPKDIYILDTVGWIFYKQGQIEKAVKYLEAAYKGAPANKGIKSIIAEHLGDAYFRHDFFKKARIMYQEAASAAESEGRANEIRNKLKKLDQQKTRLPAAAKLKVD